MKKEDIDDLNFSGEILNLVAGIDKDNPDAIKKMEKIISPFIMGFDGKNASVEFTHLMLTFVLQAVEQMCKENDDDDNTLASSIIFNKNGKQYVCETEMTVFDEDHAEYKKGVAVADTYKEHDGVIH